jgi:outer membrane lipoprotein carrier protein
VRSTFSRSATEAARGARRDALRRGLVLLGCSWALAGAAPAPETAELLDAIQAHYDAIESSRGEFEQTSRVVALGRDETSRGSVVVERPGRMRWEYRTPERSVIVVDGESIRIYSPGERKLQIAPLGPHAMSPTALGFLLGEADLRESFRAERLEVSDPKEIRLRLVPKAEAGFQHLELRLDAAGLGLRGSLLVDLFGNRTELLFHDLRYDGEIAPDTFEIRVPDGTEVIDLR